MFPVKRPWTPDEDEGFSVLVPGLMGVGFLISLVVLLVDATVKLLPKSGRRQRAMVEGRARSRANDVLAVQTGAAPAPLVIQREPRRRLSSLTFALLAAAAAIAIILGGVYIAENHVGEDRQVWVISWALVFAAPLIAAAIAWVSAGAAGSRTPRWLRWLHQLWPLGRYPDLDKET